MCSQCAITVPEYICESIVLLVPNFIMIRNKKRGSFSDSDDYSRALFQQTTWTVKS